MLQVAEATNAPTFDPWQFYKPHVRVVSAETRIAFSDLARMSSTKRVSARARRWIPDWSLDNSKLKAVILERTRLNKAAHLRPSEKETRVHLRAVERAGSFPALLAGIAYRAWRLGLDSVTIATEMKIQPMAVRQIIFKMNLTARKLFEENYDPVKEAETRKARAAKREQEKALRKSAQRQKEKLQRALSGHLNRTNSLWLAQTAAARMKKYGKPEFDENIQCWFCRVEKRLGGPGNMRTWFCETCWNYRQTHGGHNPPAMLREQSCQS